MKLAVAWTDFEGRTGDASNLWDREHVRWTDWVVKRRKLDRELINQFSIVRNRTVDMIRHQQYEQLNVRPTNSCTVGM